MYLEQIREYCLTKKGVTEHFPFDKVTLVFKVMNKMFALVSIDSWEQGSKKINLKCNPEWSSEIRGEYDGINPGFHMNKKHWNTVTIQEDVSDKFVLELIDHSYDLVIEALPKKVKRELEKINSSY